MSLVAIMLLLFAWAACAADRIADQNQQARATNTPPQETK